MSTFPDGLFQYGGQPVGGGRYESMWGNKVYFVDYDNGTASAGGLRPDNACKYLQTAIDLASAWDTIYIRPRTPSTSVGSPAGHLPASTTNWTIAYTKHGLSLLGTGVGIPGFAGTYGTLLQGTATAGATPALYIKAPLVNCENLAFHRGGSTLGTTGVAVKATFTDAGTDQAFQLTFNNCAFVDNDYASGGKSYGLDTDSVWYKTITNCTFLDCGWSLTINASNSVTQGDQIVGCKFMGVTADVLCHIYSAGAVKNILIDRCTFNHVLPTGGSPNKYVAFNATSTGLMCDCYTGAAADTIATNVTLNGVIGTRIYNAQILPMA